MVRVSLTRGRSVFEKAGSQQILFDILTVDILGKEERILASNVRLDYDGAALSWSPAGSYLSFHAGGTADKARDCYVVNLKSRKLQNLTYLQPQHPSDSKGGHAPLGCEGVKTSILLVTSRCGGHP